ncbi:hypothetical protein ACFQ60_22475 [Streptomyces zhihengii]
MTTVTLAVDAAVFGTVGAGGVALVLSLALVLGVRGEAASSSPPAPPPTWPSSPPPLSRPPARCGLSPSSSPTPSSVCSGADMTTSQQPPNTATEAPALARVPDAWLTFWAGVWRAAAIVFIGSGIISGVIVGWISRGLAARLTGLILGAGVILGLPYTWRILGLTAALWLALAIVLGRRVTTSSKPKEKDKEQPAKAPKRTVADLTREETVTALHTLLKPSGECSSKPSAITWPRASAQGPSAPARCAPSSPATASATGPE